MIKGNKKSLVLHLMKADDVLVVFCCQKGILDPFKSIIKIVNDFFSYHSIFNSMSQDKFFIKILSADIFSTKYY